MLRVAHTSDLHLDDRERGIRMLRRVIATAEAAEARVLVLAGDIFDHNRVSLGTLDAVTRVFGDAAMDIVILPGNHDCLGLDSVYRRGGIAAPRNVHVLGVTSDDTLDLEAHDLSVWGRAHAEYRDMNPLRDPSPRLRRHHIAVAHGHWVTGPEDLHRSWLLHHDDLESVDADYIALGHWDRAVHLDSVPVPTFYSGSPDLARSINLVALGSERTWVERLALLPEGG
ncbi:MAG: metallophosphoesterase family protein [Hyphomicrobiales bacterium]